MNSASPIATTPETEYELPPISLPWRAFKAFMQLFDLETGLCQVDPRRLLLFSENKAGEKLRALLKERRLILWSEERQRHVLLHGVPLGRDSDPDYPATPIVRPVDRPVKGTAWNLTEGRCAYCGTYLSFFHHLSVYPTPALTTVTEDLPPLYACKSCHSTRGKRSLEEMREMIGMRLFEHHHGIRFSQRQIAWLKAQGYELDIPRTRFWFEEARIAGQ